MPFLHRGCCICPFKGSGVATLLGTTPTTGGITEHWRLGTKRNIVFASDSSYAGKQAISPAITSSSDVHCLILLNSNTYTYAAADLPASNFNDTQEIWQHAAEIDMPGISTLGVNPGDRKRLTKSLNLQADGSKAAFYIQQHRRIRPASEDHSSVYNRIGSKTSCPGSFDDRGLVAYYEAVMYSKAATGSWETSNVQVPVPEGFLMDTCYKVNDNAPLSGTYRLGSEGVQLWECAPWTGNVYRSPVLIQGNGPRISAICTVVLHYKSYINTYDGKGGKTTAVLADNWCACDYLITGNTCIATLHSTDAPYYAGYCTGYNYLAGYVASDGRAYVYATTGSEYFMGVYDNGSVSWYVAEAALSPYFVEDNQGSIYLVSSNTQAPCYWRVMRWNSDTHTLESAGLSKFPANVAYDGGLFALQFDENNNWVLGYHSGGQFELVNKDSTAVVGGISESGTNPFFTYRCKR